MGLPRGCDVAQDHEHGPLPPEGVFDPGPLVTGIPPLLSGHSLTSEFLPAGSDLTISFQLDLIS